MRALLNGERVGSFAQVLLAIALILVAAVAVAVGAVAMLDATSARHQARTDRDVLRKVTTALHTQCQQQLESEARLRGLEQTDAELQQGLIAADARNDVITPTIRDARRSVYERKLAKDFEFLRGPAQTPAVCDVYARVQSIAYQAAR